MLPNEVFALECIARYAREGLVVDSRNGQFAHCPYPEGMGDSGYYLTFNDHQKQGLLQSVDVGRKCYWTGDVKAWLDTWPPGCFELWDIYNEFNARTKESRIKQSTTCRGRTGALHPASKAIIVIKPDGTKLHFGSGHEAARELGTHQAIVSRCLTNGNSPRRGKLKGYQFLYA